MVVLTNSAYPSAVLRFIGQLYNVLFSIFISGMMGVAAYALWGMYHDARLAEQFAAEGQLVPVRVAAIATEPRAWADYLGNVAYLTFSYGGKSYTARYVRDTAYVGVGDRVTLLHHAELDAFRQPGPQFRYKQREGVSRLIRWSVLRTLSLERQLLIACLGMTALFGAYTVGAVARLTGHQLAREPAQFLTGVGLLLLSLWLAYDAWQYWQYYHQLKTSGQSTTVRVIETERTSLTRKSRYRILYTYAARVYHNGRERKIPLEETDYDRLHPGDPLPVLYQATLDDMMPVNYTMSYPVLLAPVLLGLVSLLFFYRKPTKKASA
jgi:hypothetical protein